MFINQFFKFIIKFIDKKDNKRLQSDNIKKVLKDIDHTKFMGPPKRQV